MAASDSEGPSGPDNVLVHLKTGQAWSVHGQVIDGATGTAVAEFPRRESPTVPVGEYVELVFWGAEVQEPMPLRARVTDCSQHGNRFRYHFQFEPGAIDALLSGALNRRRAMRIRPDDGTPVRVLVQGSRQSVEGVLQDISDTGAGILICREDEAALFEDWKLTLVLRLSEDEEPLVLIGDVRYRRLQGSQLHYGIEFDHQNTTDFELQSARIRAYVESQRFG